MSGDEKPVEHDEGREASVREAEEIRTADYDFDLPPELIAQRPLPRGESRLLVLPANGPPAHRRFRELPTLLRAGDRLVVNDTRVLPCRLNGRKLGDDGATSGRVEILLLERERPDRWWALARPGRRLRPGVRLAFSPLGADAPTGGSDAQGPLLVAVVEGRTEERFRLRFDRSLDEVLEDYGRMPLPPYIERDDDERDRADYQTTFARSPGAVAAPTAGLHFDRALLDRLARFEIGVTRITLHVGPGTFRPVTEPIASRHRLDAEPVVLSLAAVREIETTRARGGRIVAVGTTSVRALESAADEEGKLRAGRFRTGLFILPGFRFRIVDALVTNFHLPRSTLVMLVSALAGRERVLDAYRAAIAERYRFYSYGDAMLVERRVKSK